MKAAISISEEIMDRLAGSLELPPFYDEDDRNPEADGEALSYAIELMVELCAD